MPLLADRVRETTTTTGQGTLTLDGAPSGFRTFSGAFGNAVSVYYVIAGPSEWEIGIGTTGAGTLTRDTVLVSSAGGTTKVTFAAGTKDVFCSYVADRAVTTSDAATLTNKTIDDYTNNVGANSTHFRIKAGATLAKGDVVKASGFTPGESAIEVVKTASATDVAIGIVEQALTTGQFGMAVVIGELFDVNTNGLAVGATLYQNGAGGYTTTRPSSGLVQALGWVVRANTNNGVIAVNIVNPQYVEASANTANTLVLRDGSGNFSAGTVTATLSGAAPAGSLSGNTLASGVTASSLTSVGTLSSLTVSGAAALATSSGSVRAGNAALSASNNYGTPVLGASSDSFTAMHVEAHNDTPGNFAFLGLMRSRGTQAAPTHIQANDPVGSVSYQVYNDAGSFPYRSCATIDAIAAANHSAGNLPTAIRFFTTPSGSNSPTERMRLDASGNLGIGTTAPIAQLSNSSTSDSITGTQPTGFVWRSTNNDWASAIISRPSSGLSYGLRVHTGGATASDYPLWVSSGAGTGTQLFAINGAGNLGLGVTPSAWESTCRMLQLGAVATVGRANSGETQLGFNYFINTSGQYIYIQSLNATRYEQTGGQHRWFTAASGTAGAAISFTQAMTLDASGNLMVGTTSIPAGQRLRVAGGDVALEGRYLYLVNADAEIQMGAAQNARIINTDSTNTLSISRTGASSVITLATAGSERARIDASGNVIVNTAAVATTATNGFLYVSSCAGTPTGTPTSYTGRVPIVVDTTNHKLYFYSGGTWRDAGP